jgi:hypothetical protein
LKTEEPYGNGKTAVINALAEANLSMLKFVMSVIKWCCCLSVGSHALAAEQNPPGVTNPARLSNISQPIVTAWACPRDYEEKQITRMAEAGLTAILVQGKDGLDMLQRHGMRGIVYITELAKPDNWTNAAIIRMVDDRIESVKNHPALYAYLLEDEPDASRFAILSKARDHVEQIDPDHPVWVNLLPLSPLDIPIQRYCTDGETNWISAYEKYYDRFIAEVRPKVLSYDFYPFWVNGDDGLTYFLHQSLFRAATLKAGIPSMTFVQNCSWADSFRIPGENEMRWSMYTSLAYGVRDICYYVANEPGHRGALFEGPTDKPSPNYYASKKINPEFVAIATELRPFTSLAVYHAGDIPFGTCELPDSAPFRLEPAQHNARLPVPDFVHSRAIGPPAKGFVLGYFGTNASPTHALVVNLNYTKAVRTTVVGPGKLEVFDLETRKWTPMKSNRADVEFQPGGGALVRIAAGSGTNR